MWIYNFKDYKRFLNDLISSLPRQGRGQSSALAKRLNVQQSVVSSILNHDRHFTIEQGIEVAAFFGFDSKTTDYFILLIQYKRADTPSLKTYLKGKLDQLREEQMTIRALKPEEYRELSEADKGVYYSNWYYSAARMALFIPEYRSVDALATFLKLSRGKTASILDFFIKAKLVTLEDGEFVPTPVDTMIGTSSEFLNNHRRNWRDKAREKFPESSQSDYFITMPMVLGEKDAQWLREEIRKLIETMVQRLDKSPEEVKRCLNIDLFEF